MLSKLISRILALLSSRRRPNCMVSSVANASAAAEKENIIRLMAEHFLSKSLRLAARALESFAAAVRNRDIIAVCRNRRIAYKDISALKDSMDELGGCLKSPDVREDCLMFLQDVFVYMRSMLELLDKLTESMKYGLSNPDIPLPSYMNESLTEILDETHCCFRDVDASLCSHDVDPMESMQAFWLQCERIDRLASRQYFRSSTQSYNEDSSDAFCLCILHLLSSMMKSTKQMLKHYHASTDTVGVHVF